MFDMQTYALLSLILTAALFVIGIPLGLFVILTALLRRPRVTQTLGRFCAQAGTGCALLLAALSIPVWGPVALAFLLPLLIPAGLAAIGLAINEHYKDLPPLKGLQFTLPAIIYVTLLVALVAGYFNFAKGSYYHERDQMLATFRQMPHIENVQALGYDFEEGGYYDVTAIEFSLAGRPKTRVRITADREFTTCQSSDPLRRLKIEQIGPWSFYGWETLPPEPADPEQRRRQYRLSSLSLGTEGHGRDVFPFRIESIDDIVTHYDELIALAETWSAQNGPTTFEKDGQTISFWVNED